MSITNESKATEVSSSKAVSSIDPTFVGFDFSSVDTGIEAMLRGGVHFGHMKSRLHPKMADFVFTTRENVNIIDLEKTGAMLERAGAFLASVAKSGKPILFVGMKKHTHGLVRSLAAEMGEHFVVDRWLGGTLTNFPVVSKRATYLRETKEKYERGELKQYTKLERQRISEELERMEKRMGGIQQMRELPGVVIIADAKNAALPIREARAIGIPVVAIVDTNTDPEQVEYPIPGNDDALSSLRLLLGAIGKYVKAAKRPSGAVKTTGK